VIFPGLYEEVRDSVGRMFDDGAPDPLEQFGLDDLLTSDDPEHRNAAFAVAEAQGRTGRVSEVVSRIALAGTDVPLGARYASHLAQMSSRTPSLIGLLGNDGSDVELVLVEANGSACGLSGDELKPMSSPLDPEYLTVLSYAPDSGRVLRVAGMDDVKARAQVACSAETLGACEAMLDDAVQYTGSRRQFGASLASFQAVSHSLAWAATEIEQLRALLRVCLTSDAVGTPDHTIAAATKSLAGTVSKRVAKITLQVTGGMGFTWEYSHNALHRRVLALDAVAGSSDLLNLELGRLLRQQGGAKVADLAAISLPTLAGAHLHRQGDIST
jgi:hypothetical protein